MAERSNSRRKRRGGAASDASGRQQVLPLTWDETADGETSGDDAVPAVTPDAPQEAKEHPDDTPPWDDGDEEMGTDASVVPEEAGGNGAPEAEAEAEITDEAAPSEGLEIPDPDPEAEALEWDVEPEHDEGGDDDDYEDTAFAQKDDGLADAAEELAGGDSEPEGREPDDVDPDSSEPGEGEGCDPAAEGEPSVEEDATGAGGVQPAEVFELEEELHMTEPDRSSDNAAAPAGDSTEEPHVVTLGDAAMSLGQTLAEARGTHNMTLSQVAQKTRIPKDIIEHLETDQLELLPPPIYMRSHISHLCEEYEIDPKVVLREYEKTVASRGVAGEDGAMVVTSEPAESGSKVQYRIAGGPGLSSPRTSGRLSRILVASAIVLLIALVVAALGVQQWRNRQPVDVSENGESGTENVVPPIDLEQFVIPQQLPLKKLPVPDE